MWLRLGSDTSWQPGISVASSRAVESGTRRSSRECSSSVGHVHLRGDRRDVDARERLEEAHGVVRRGRAPLQLVELLPLLTGAVGEELRREHLAERRVVASPPDPGDLEVERGLAGAAPRWSPGRAGPARRRRRGPGCVTRSGCRAAKATATAAPCETPEQREAVEPDGVDDELEVVDPVVEAEVVDVPVRQPAAPLVVADQRAAVGEALQPVPPDRVLEVVVEVGQPVGRLDEHRPRAHRGVGDAGAVGRRAEADRLVQRDRPRLAPGPAPA